MGGAKGNRVSSMLEVHGRGKHAGHPRRRCPLCNPAPVEPRISTASGSWAHRGYLVRWNPISRYWWIEKGGHNLGSCTGLEDGRRIIDELLN